MHGVTMKKKECLERMVYENMMGRNKQKDLATEGRRALQ
jgi:hypothetical protein